MDNTNQNSSANPSSTSPFGDIPQAPSDLSSQPTSVQPAPVLPLSDTGSTFPQPQSMPPFPPSPTPNWPPAPESSIPSMEPSLPLSNTGPNPPVPAFTSSWPQDTTPAVVPPTQGSTGSDLTSGWTPPVSNQFQTPVQPEPISNPWSSPQPAVNTVPSQQVPAWTPPAAGEPQTIPQPQTPTQPEPTPTFPPQPTNPSDTTQEMTSSTPTQPSWMMNTQTPVMPTSPTEAAPVEAAPTDLSHLISGNQPESSSIPSNESLVVPTAGVSPEVPNLPAETHKGIPKWLIGLGVGLLIVVLGASAYFILGVGQPAKTPTSLPVATTPPQATQTRSPLPATTSTAQPSPSTATGSANFGQLGGTPPATSAADLIRQRQQGK